MHHSIRQLLYYQTNLITTRFCATITRNSHTATAATVHGVHVLIALSSLSNDDFALLYQETTVRIAGFIKKMIKFGKMKNPSNEPQET